MQMFAGNLANISGFSCKHFLLLYQTFLVSHANISGYSWKHFLLLLQAFTLDLQTYFGCYRKSFWLLPQISSVATVHSLVASFLAVILLPVIVAVVVYHVTIVASGLGLLKKFGPGLNGIGNRLRSAGIFLYLTFWRFATSLELLNYYLTLAC